MPAGVSRHPEIETRILELRLIAAWIPYQRRATEIFGTILEGNERTLDHQTDRVQHW